MANRNRRIKRIIKNATKENRPVDPTTKKGAPSDDTRARRDHVRQELKRLQGLNQLTRYQHKRLLQLTDEYTTLNEVLRKQ